MLEYFKRIRWIFYFSLVGSLVSLLISSFIAKPVYESSVILVPSIEDINQMQSQALLFYQLTRGGMSSPAQIFIDLASSYNFKREFIEKNNLLEVFGEKDIDNAVKTMDSKFQIEPLPSGAFALRVRDVDIKRAEELAEKYISFLNEKANLTLNARGKELRRFLEGRLKDVEDSIRILGDSITAFEKREKVFVLSAEDILAPSISELIANIAKKEVELLTLKAVFSEKIPDVSILRKELNALNSNLSQKFSYLPENLRRAYEYRIRLMILSEVYKTIYAEYEKAKILEKKDNPIIQPASEPMGKKKRVWPKRVVPIFATTFMMGLGTFFMLISFMISDRLRETPFGTLVEQIKRDFKL